MHDLNDDAEALELVTQAAARMDGGTGSPKHEKAAAALLQRLKSLNGSGGLRVMADNNQDGVIVELRSGNQMRRVWVGHDDAGLFYVRSVMARGGAAGELEEVKGLRLDWSQTMLEGSDDDAFYTPEPGKPRRKRSSLAVLVEAITRRMTAT